VSDAASHPAPPRRRQHRFRQRNALATHSLHFGPNMTPMVDVVMVILIFFMASAAFLGSEWFLRAAIPFQSGRGSDPTKKNDPLALPAARFDVIMDVDEKGETVVSFIELKRAPLAKFVERIAALPNDDQTKQLEIILRPTPKVPYRDVVTAHSSCDAMGIQKVGIQVSRPAEPAKP
jgi:biopolymer transport protein ExbD